LKSPSIGTVYLARFADGIAAFQRFADSYRRHPGGIEHELIVVYKGFDQHSRLQKARAVFHGFPHLAIELEDRGFDTGSYLETSRRVPHDYLCYLNTHTEIVATGWLAALADHASREEVGVAAAMGSYESLRDTALLLRKVIWRCVGVGSSYDERLAYYFDFVLRPHHPKWFTPAGVIPPSARRRGFLRKAAIACARALRYRWFIRSGTALIWPGAPPFDIQQFPVFPNPHIRSNGFMMRRERLLTLGLADTRTKMDASLFESGTQSLTAQIRRHGLVTTVVGRDGSGYDVRDWWRSGTFRLGDQKNLLIADNHTRAFEMMSEGARAAHARMTWGDYLGPAPEDFPDLGYGFRRTAFPLASP
jgi:hypothetical protein